jgi:hypothetical protein
MIDVIAVCFCAVIALYVFKIVKINRLPLGEHADRLPGSRLNEGVASLVAESERALDRISLAVNRERAVLQALRQKNEAGTTRQRALPPRTEQPTGEEGEPKARKRRSRAKTADDPYTEAVRCAGEGLGVKEISERVKLPQGEVMLALKLRGRGRGGARQSEAAR